VAGHQDRLAFAGQALHEIPDPEHALGIQAVDRLVEQQYLWVAQHGGGDAEPLGHAERVAACPLAGDVAKADEFQHGVDPAGGQALGLGQVEQVVAGAAAVVNGLGLQQGADGPQRVNQIGVALAVDRRRPAIGPVQAEDQPHRGRFTGAVGAEEPGDTSRLHGKREVIDRHLVAESLGQVTRFDHRFPHPAKLAFHPVRVTAKVSKADWPRGSPRSWP
jgi:hypothetical protein